MDKRSKHLCKSVFISRKAGQVVANLFTAAEAIPFAAWREMITAEVQWRSKPF